MAVVVFSRDGVVGDGNEEEAVMGDYPVVW